MTTDQLDIEEAIDATKPQDERDHDEIKKLMVDLGLALSGHTPRIMLVAMSAVFSSVVRLRRVPPTKDEIDEMYDILKAETLADVRDGIPNMFGTVASAPADSKAN